MLYHTTHTKRLVHSSIFIDRIQSALGCTNPTFARLAQRAFVFRFILRTNPSRSVLRECILPEQLREDVASPATRPTRLLVILERMSGSPYVGTVPALEVTKAFMASKLLAVCPFARCVHRCCWPFFHGSDFSFASISFNSTRLQHVFTARVYST
jgi:hypothetical protein